MLCDAQGVGGAGGLYPGGDLYALSPLFSVFTETIRSNSPRVRPDKKDEPSIRRCHQSVLTLERGNTLCLAGSMGLSEGFADIHSIRRDPT